MGVRMRRIAVKRLGFMRFPVRQRQYWCKFDDRPDTEPFEYTALNMREAAESFMAGMYCRGPHPEPHRVLVSADERRWYRCTVMLQPKPRAAANS